MKIKPSQRCGGFLLVIWLLSYLAIELLVNELFSYFFINNGLKVSR